MIPDEHLEFLHAVWIRRTPLTKAFLAVNIFVFLLMTFAGRATNEATLIVFGLRYRDSIPPHFKRAVGTGVLPVIVINLIIGFTIPGIDNSAHIGGLVTGAALALLVPYLKPGTQTNPVFKAAQVMLLIL